MPCEGHYKDLLKGGNLKNTRQRASILKALENAGQPITAEDIYLLLKDDKVSISLSTVYRVLDTLVEKGLALKNTMTDNPKAFYELKNHEHRHHLLCVGCHKMLPVDGCPLKDYEKLLEEKFGFSVKGHKLEVFGYCEGCREKPHST
ncbi:MAG: transcriptional repressor [Clostridia bacterium]|nr:transcriptional repressor [Clostridia bacterium]